jgi:hypothetical protein
MKVKGFKQLDGKWVSFERKVGLGEYLRHSYYGWWTVLNYYWQKIRD